MSGVIRASAEPARRVQHQPGVARMIGDRREVRLLDEVERFAVVEQVDGGGGHLGLGHAAPPGRVGDRMHAVLVGVQADRGGLDPQRHVLGDQRDVSAVAAEVQRDGQDARVVAVDAEPGGQHRQIGVVELDVQGAAVVADRYRRVEATVRDPQFVQYAQRLPGEPAQLGMVPLAFQLADHHERQDDLVLGEAAERAGVGQQTPRCRGRRCGR